VQDAIVTQSWSSRPLSLGWLVVHIAEMLPPARMPAATRWADGHHRLSDEARRRGADWAIDEGRI
jgi:hypothetical protein